MARQKSAFFCQNCGAQSPKWIGKCPSCGEWNTYVEEILGTAENQAWNDAGLKLPKTKPISITEIEANSEVRIKTNDLELDRVLGGGLVNGSLVLIGGEPGIGKSTLLLQIALKMTLAKILYVSGEESEQQIKMRAVRIGQNQNSSLYILTETNLNSIFEQIKILKPAILIIDSIQTIFTDKVEAASGSISQVRQCTGELMMYAKKTNTLMKPMAKIAMLFSIGFMGASISILVLNTMNYKRNSMFPMS